MIHEKVYIIDKSQGCSLSNVIDRWHRNDRLVSKNIIVNDKEITATVGYVSKIRGKTYILSHSRDRHRHGDFYSRRDFILARDVIRADCLPDELFEI